MRQSNFYRCLVAGLLISLASAAAGDDNADTSFDSPQLRALAKQLAEVDKLTRQAAEEKFWAEVRRKAPLVEPVDGDPQSSWVTYLWHGTSETHRVAMAGGLNYHEFEKPLTQLANSDVWYRTEKTPNEARFVYWFLINRPAKAPTDSATLEKLWKENPPRPDPLNPLTLVADRGSLLQLGEAPPQPWMQRVPGAPPKISFAFSKIFPGPAIGQFKLKSDHLQAEREFAVYTPPNYDPRGEPCWLMVMFDGNGCRQIENNSLPVAVILDNLVIEKKIPPLVVAFVFQTSDRDKELSCSEPFGNFVAKELVPWVRKGYHISADPRQSIVCGMSLGGLMSSYCGLAHSDVFGSVLSLSGSYQWFPGSFDPIPPRDGEPGWLTRQFAKAERVPVRFYITAGKFENFYPVSLLVENRRFRDVLEAKGYPLKYAEFYGGHDSVGWRSPLVDGLIELTRPASKVTE